MCGFIGRINSPGEGRSLPAIETGLKYLGRRGPDSSSVWSTSDGRVELLHVRLAIVDTDIRAQQPFTAKKDGITVAFNGEIYNYRELRAEVTDYEFRTMSDTEVIIALYVTRGLSGLTKLRGMFSLVIVDSHLRRVFLARDAIGKKPLFLARFSRGTYFGSSLLALVAASGEDTEVAAESLSQFWKDAHVAPHASLIKRCKPVLPGQVLEVNWNGEVTRKLSCLPKIKFESSADLGVARERVSALILESVRRRLSNNSNPVCLISGGVDSTVVAACMKTLAGGSAITLGSFLPGTNDEKYARFAAKRLDLSLHVVRARSNELADDVAWALGLQDEPLAMASFFPLALMIRAAKGYGKILLTGDGGDEVFLGYGTQDDWLKKASQDSAPPNTSCAPLATPQWMSSWGQATVTSSLVGHMFTKLDRASAEQGVEARCPLLDFDLIAFIRTLAPEILFFDGRTKALLKDQLASWPRGFVNRPKMGFTYNLRWAWAATRFAGLREMISHESLETFSPQLPEELKASPGKWSSVTVFRNFPAVWKLLTWSRFVDRLRAASHVSGAEKAVAENAARLRFYQSDEVTAKLSSRP